jgi:hypothetical protein
MSTMSLSLLDIFEPGACAARRQAAGAGENVASRSGRRGPVDRQGHASWPASARPG